MTRIILASFTMLCISFLCKAENGKPIRKAHLPVPQIITIEDTLVKTDITISSSVTNTYYWRGITFSKGMMFQPSVTVAHGNWFSSVWSNVVVKETRNNKYVPEVDFTAGYAYENGEFNIIPQANLFFYPLTGNAGTMEVGAEMKYDLESIGFYLNPNVDVGSNPGGFYVDYGLCKAGEINPRLSYDLRFLLGWGNKKFRNYYEQAPVVETIATSLTLREESMKSMRVQLGAGYQATNHLTIQPQLIAFRNFMTEYTFQHSLFQLNGSLTCSYAF